MCVCVAACDLVIVLYYASYNAQLEGDALCELVAAAVQIRTGEEIFVKLLGTDEFYLWEQVKKTERDMIRVV